MNKYTRKDIIRMVEEEDVEFIRLQFTDIFGILKNVAITKRQLVRALDNKCLFDGSAIKGYGSVEESDMCLYPDLDTFTIFPWRPQQGKVARIICDVHRPDGTPYEGDCRYILKRVIEEARQMGYEFEVGTELEFFLFDLDENGKPTTETSECAGYFDLGPTDTGENARRDIVLNLEDMGFEVERSHHEVAPSQQEIDLHYEDALSAADHIVTFKLAVKTIARRHGMYATFMPKPKPGMNGSGMHVNMSLNDAHGRNIFRDDSDPNSLSKEAYYFIGGIMKHIKAMTAVLNPIVNSYKRIVPGYEAPSQIAWSTVNRSHLIRIPSDREENTRIELRSPDPATNPYLCMAVCLAAGLDGIKNEIMPPEETKGNLFEMTTEERLARGIEPLPVSLRQALEELCSDTCICNVLGRDVVEKYSRIKMDEWERYRTHVTNWEIDEYLGNY